MVEVVIYCVVVVPDFGDGIDSPLGQYPGTDALCKGRALPVIKPSSKTGPFQDFQVLLRSDCLFSSVSPPVPHMVYSPAVPGLDIEDPRGFLVALQPPPPPLKRNPGPEDIKRSPPNFPSDTPASHPV